MATPTALIKDLEGEVSVTRNGSVVNIKAGDSLLPGDVIKTGPTGRLALDFPGLAGQTAAAGVMSQNGKITLSEQAGPNGQQLVVVEEDDCFDFTTELTENSAVAGDGGGMGLFGGMLGASGGFLAAGGAIAAGAFVAGGGGSDPSGGSSVSAAGNGGGTNTGGTGGTGGLGGITDSEFGTVNSPQSLQELVQQNVTQENLQTTLLDPVQGALTASQDAPTSTPQNLIGAAEQIGVGVAGNAHDALVALTGEGSPQANLVNQLVNGLDQTPLGEPLTPVTNLVQELINTDIGLNTVIDGLPVEALQGGIVSSVVAVADNLLEPVSAQVEPVAQVMDGLTQVAAQVDTVLDGLLGGGVGDFIQGATTGLPGLELPSGGLDSLVSTIQSALGDLSVPTDANPLAALEGLGGVPNLGDIAAEGQGLLGGIDTLTTALQGASGGAGGGELINTIVSGISSGADALGGTGLPIDPNQITPS